MSPSPHSNDPNPWRNAGVGLELAAGIGIMAYLGHLFDGWQGTKPWGLLVGAALGFGGGIYNLLKDATRSGD